MKVTSVCQMALSRRSFSAVSSTMICGVSAILGYSGWMCRSPNQAAKSRCCCGLRS
ncbi:hypothetical protein D3C71_2127460 [compost metagenome]